MTKIKRDYIPHHIPGCSVSAAAPAPSWTRHCTRCWSSSPSRGSTPSSSPAPRSRRSGRSLVFSLRGSPPSRRAGVRSWSLPTPWPCSRCCDWWCWSSWRAAWSARSVWPRLSDLHGLRSPGQSRSSSQSRPAVSVDPLLTQAGQTHGGPGRAQPRCQPPV